jgi:hypothetical protein
MISYDKLGKTDRLNDKNDYSFSAFAGILLVVVVEGEGGSATTTKEKTKTLFK